MFQAKTIINEMKNLCPDIFKVCEETFFKSRKDLDFLRLNERLFEDCPSISIDNAVMENTQKGIVIPFNAEWSDIGSWKSVWENSDRDEDGNVSKGNVIIEKTKNCYLRSEKKLLVSLGLDNLVIIDTDDVTLVAEKNESENIKKVVKNLQARDVQEAVSHKKVFRPWGFYLSIADGKRFQVKIIHVKPGEKLSLQMHHHRAEHWIVVSGTAEVEISKKVTIMSENESIYIPLGSKHRLSNPGKIPLEIIEVQSGSYVGEDDIVRFDDIYGRKN